MAEAVFRHIISTRSDLQCWKVDSCGTSNYNNGDDPDYRTLDTLRLHGINNYTHKARQISKLDFDRFKWIFVMDSSNYKTVKSLLPKSSNNNLLFLRFYDPDKEEVNPSIIDPYYSGRDCFELCYQQCLKSINNFLVKEYN
ncbi:low molecular weight phosphotyrosine protein phosphatase isoform X2 [Hydra vulgaris]|uniref:Low molecular weight phosphotyrosine protein phosphatase n=1 Tax=Hydra vulgaris TaxID=6087 RepID=A0ABM4CUA0_HYDVU